jgi:hypothetical protein
VNLDRGGYGCPFILFYAKGEAWPHPQIHAVRLERLIPLFHWVGRMYDDAQMRDITDRLLAQCGWDRKHQGLLFGFGNPG